jgi:hypothetical protein
MGPTGQSKTGSSSHLGNVELIALTGSLFHAQTNGLSPIIEELLPKCEEDPKNGPTTCKRIMKTGPTPPVFSGKRPMI